VENSWPIAFPYGSELRFTAIHVHKRERIEESLLSSRPIPKADKKNAAMSD